MCCTLQGTGLCFHAPVCVAIWLPSRCLAADITKEGVLGGSSTPCLYHSIQQSPAQSDAAVCRTAHDSTWALCLLICTLSPT